MAIASVILLTAVIGFITWTLFKWIAMYIKHLQMIRFQSPKWLPFLGNVHMMKLGSADFLEQIVYYSSIYRKEGVFTVWLGTKPMIIVYQADLIEPFLNSSKHMDKSYEYEFLHPWLGTGLLTSTGEKWKSRRKMLTPTFHFKILNDFLAVFCEQVDVLVEKLNKNKDTDRVFDIFPCLTHCALDIISESAMGERINAQGHDSEYVKAIYKMSELIHVRQKQPWLWPDLVYRLIGEGKEHDHLLDILHKFTDTVISKRLTETKAEKKLTRDVEPIDSKKRMAFLDLLMHESDEMGGTLSRMDIREEVDTFMFEGHDTTAAASNWACHLIGAHPEVQAKLHDEMDHIFGESNRHPTMDDLKEMTYLECVIKETLRIFPSVPFFARTTTETCAVAGSEIPKGISIILLCYMLHRDEEYFPDAEKFDPDRFAHEETTGRHPFAYVPFSAGLRNCIGQKFAMMELKVMLSALLRNFRMESCQKREDLRPKCEIILRPEKGILLKLHSR